MSRDLTLSDSPPGRTETVECPDGTRIHCVIEGTGPTVVLAHGFMVGLVSLKLVQKPLVDAGFWVVMFDQRGHGRSTIGSDGISTEAMVRDYQALLEHFDVTDAVLVSHSMGAFVAMALAQQYPELVRKRLRGMLLVSANAGNVARAAPRTACRSRSSGSG